MISPSISFWLVRALNCLQNSMMLICAWPSAGPTGGAGVALPAAICNFTKPVTFFAMISLYDLSFSNLNRSQRQSDRRHQLLGNRIDRDAKTLQRVCAHHFHIPGLGH